MEDMLENDLNEYALTKAEALLDKVSGRLAEKAERDIIKERTAKMQENGIYCITVLCYFTDDIYKLVKQIEEKKKWKLLESRNYIDEPKKNGYRGYYLKLGIPVENQKNETAIIEIKIHTIGMEYFLEMEGQLADGKTKKSKLKSSSEYIIRMEEELLRMKKK